jgi:hypothetical protein
MTTLLTLLSVAADLRILRVPSRAGRSKSFSLLVTLKWNGEAQWIMEVTPLTADEKAFGSSMSETVTSSSLSDLGREAAFF